METNFSENLLLLGLDAYVEMHDGYKARIHFPSIKELYENPNLERFINILSINLEELKEHTLSIGFEAKTTQGLFIGIRFSKNDLIVVEDALKICLPDFTLEANGVCYDKEPLENDVLDKIKNMILVANNSISMNDYNEALSEYNLTELELKSKRHEDIIKKRKEKKASELVIEGGKTASFDEVMITILSMLQGYTLESIRDINPYTLSWLYSKSMNLVYDRISTIAAGNGLLGKGKKYKFITEK